MLSAKPVCATNGRSWQSRRDEFSESDRAESEWPGYDAKMRTVAILVK
jgi:hypothetical protein